MAPRMRVLMRSQAQERTRLSLEYFEPYVTIGVGGMDINIALLVMLRRFIKEECMAGLCYVEREVWWSFDTQIISSGC